MTPAAPPPPVVVQTDTRSFEERVQEAFQALDGTPLQGYDALRRVREEALARFLDLGLPTPRTEAYKYTQIAKALRHPYALDPAPDDSTLDADDVEDLLVPGFDAHVAVLVNGRFRADLSRLDAVTDDVTVCSLHEAAERLPEVFEQHFNTMADDQQDPFVALNAAFALDGLFVYVPKGKQLEKPVHLLHVTDTNEDLLVQPRSLVVVERSAEARFVETEHCFGEGRTFTNSVLEVFVGDNAHAKHVRVQDAGDDASELTTLEVHQGRDSTFETDVITLSGQLIRNNLHLLHTGTGVHSRLYGLTIGRGDMHVDNHTLVDHAQPQCTSDELYKTILDDASTGVFNGKVFVHRDAQQTNAYQKNNSVLLSDRAKMNAKPELEIYADDVQCSHGATTGQLDPMALFYLRQRGLSEDRARVLLLTAFARDAVDAIPFEPLREHLDGRITQILHAMAH